MTPAGKIIKYAVLICVEETCGKISTIRIKLIQYKPTNQWHAFYYVIYKNMKFMKQVIINSYKGVALFLGSLLLSVLCFAQDKKVDVNINTKSGNDGNVFMQPWVWVVGGAVFLIIIVALLRNNSNK